MDAKLIKLAFLSVPGDSSVKIVDQNGFVSCVADFTYGPDGSIFLLTERFKQKELENAL